MGWELRTLRHHVVRRFKCRLAKDAALMTWLVSWAVGAIFKYKAHSTGRTSYEWITGHRCNQPVAGFAEKSNSKFATDKNHRH